MNERIRELAEQATKYAHTKNDSLHQFNLDALYEKFAELIVRECGEWCGHDTQGVAAMFKHFGVEE